MTLGLRAGLFFGVIGNTDHHNASPGSYGFGRTGIWAEERSRDGIWNAFLKRRTVALSGDPIEIDYKVDGHPMGTVYESEKISSTVDCYIAGCSRLSHVDFIINDRTIRTIYNPHHEIADDITWIPLEFGWGKKNIETFWKVNICVEYGDILEASPRFRGEDVVAPLDDIGNRHRIEYALCGNHINLDFFSNGNLNTLTDNGQGLVLCISEASSAIVLIDINATYNGKQINRRYSYRVSEIINPVVEYLDGFVSPAVLVGVPVQIGESCCHLTENIDIPYGHSFYIRAFEDNGDFVIASPVRKVRKVE